MTMYGYLSMDWMFDYVSIHSHVHANSMTMYGCLSKEWMYDYVSIHSEVHANSFVEPCRKVIKAIHTLFC